MINLPRTQPYLEGHTDESCSTNPSTVADATGAQGELAVLFGHVVGNLGEGANIDQASQETLPEDDYAHHVEVGDEIEESVQGQDDEVDDLQQGRQI
jgi:hypothetical protein